MENFIDSMVQVMHINRYVLLIVLCSGYFQQWSLAHYKFHSNGSVDGSWKTFIVSMVVSAVYFLLTADMANWKLLAADYFLSLFTANALYQMALKPITSGIESFVRRKFKE